MSRKPTLNIPHPPARPGDAPDFDYVSFALQITGGVAYPEYVKDQELLLFTFKNAYGCDESDSVISIVDNEGDEFMPPNSANANIR